MLSAVARIARAQTSCRVDLAGGTLDIWPLGLLHPGARTVCVAIDVWTRAELRSRSRGYRLVAEDTDVERDDLTALAAAPGCALGALVAKRLELPPVEIHLASASPRGAGLGASSALACALAVAGGHWRSGPPPATGEVVAFVRDVEAELMGLPTGTQDHYAALLGGALEIEHLPGGARVRRLEFDEVAFGDALILAYSGTSHVSAQSNWHVVRRRLDGEDESRVLFDGIAEVARTVSGLLTSGDLAGVGEAMSRDWALRRRLSDGVATPRIESILAAALTAGAWGGKACGAGGGGCVAILAPPARRAAVLRAVAAAGGSVIPARPAREGVRSDG